MFQIWLIKVLAALILQTSLCRCMESCCPGSVEWTGGRNCSDGSEISIECPFGMYELDPVGKPDEDNFTLFEEGLALAGSSHLMKKHEFCTGTKTNNSPMALVCFESPSTNLEWRYVLFGTFAMISAFFLFVTLIVYAILPELRDLQGKILICAMSTLLGAFLLLAITQLNPNEVLYNDDDLCKFIAFAMYYCFMSAFFWMNLVAFNVWRMAWFRTPLIHEDAWFWIYSSVAFGIPGIFLMIALVGHHTEGIVVNPGFGQKHCWFVDSYETWIYLYIPVGCLMTLNVVYFSLTCYELWHKYKNFSGSRLKVLRFKCMLYLKLVWVMGITWIFEVLSFASGPEWSRYWLLTDALNALQGFIIFMLLVATRKRVRKLLAKKKPFGLNFPKKWAAGDDEECEIVLSEEEVELSQSG